MKKTSGQLRLGEKELRVLEEIEKQKPEWKFYNQSEKAKEIFWAGASLYLK